MGKLDDKMFWFFNKKQGSPMNVYLSAVIPWVLLGWMLALGAILLAMGIAEAETRVVTAGVACLILQLGLGIFLTINDKKRGYLTAIHNNYLRRRKEIAERLGKEI